jgi:hypothetical protein
MGKEIFEHSVTTHLSLLSAYQLDVIWHQGYILTAFSAT